MGGWLEVRMLAKYISLNSEPASLLSLPTSLLPGGTQGRLCVWKVWTLIVRYIPQLKVLAVSSGVRSWGIVYNFVDKSDGLQIEKKSPNHIKRVFYSLNLSQSIVESSVFILYFHKKPFLLDRQQRPPDVRRIWILKRLPDRAIFKGY